MGIVAKHRDVQICTSACGGVRQAFYCNNGAQWIEHCEHIPYFLTLNPRFPCAPELLVLFVLQAVRWFDRAQPLPRCCTV